jgi:hypothetical protein
VASTTGHGLAAEVFAGNVNHAHSLPPTIAPMLPPATDVNAGAHQVGGLPANVHIR